MDKVGERARERVRSRADVSRGLEARRSTRDVGPRGDHPTAWLLLSLAALVILIAGMRAATWLVLPAVLGVFVTIMVVPLLYRMRSWGAPVWLSVGSVMLLVLATLAGTGVLLGRIFGDFVGTVSEYGPIFRNALARALGLLEGFGLDISPASVTETIEVDKLLARAGTFAGGLISLAANILFVTVMVGFMLAEARGLGRKLDAALGAQASRREQLIEAVAKVRRYIWIKTLISLATGVLAGVACWIAGVEAPLLWGVLAFALNYIPMFGSLVAAIPPCLLALSQSWLVAIVLALVYLAINVVMANIIEPRVLGPRMGLSPAVILLSLLFWGWIFGAMGLLLAVPFTMLVRSYCHYHEDLRWLAVLLSSSAGVEEAYEGRSGLGPDEDGAEDDARPLGFTPGEPRSRVVASGSPTGEQASISKTG